MKKFENFLNESRKSFTITLGRSFTGFQRACYDAADQLGIDIDIKRMASFLTIDYRITLNGNQRDVDRFIEWSRNNIQLNQGEYEEG